MVDNPYARVGRVALNDHFVERRLLVNRIERAWQRTGIRPVNLSVLGHHRTGKTSLVHWVADHCTRTDLHTIFIDIGTLQSGEEMFRALVSETMRILDSPFRLEPIAAAAIGAQTWDHLRHAVTDFFMAVCDSRTYVMIVLDEFDRASLVCRERAEFQLLRNLASENYSVGIVAISRRRVADIESDAAGGSILDGVLSLKQHVGMFTSGETHTMLSRATPLGVDLQSFREPIVDVAGYHPYLLELLCFAIIDHYQDTGVVDVDQACQAQAATFRDYFDRLAEIIRLDLGDKGLALVRDLAQGAPPSREYARELDRFRDLGLISVSADSPALFAPSFARHILAM
jgi:hypothetical protein